MKALHILSSAALSLAALAFTASCADDNDSNPVMKSPSTFQLNTPTLANLALDLENTTDSIELNWSQPDYGAPLITTYKLQYVVSQTGNEITTDSLGNSTFVLGTEVKEYDETTTKCRYKLAPADVNMLILRECGITNADQLPENTTVYYRVSAKTTSSSEVYSNVVKLSYKPYFVNTTVADPVNWYFTGSCFGEGGWGGDILTGMVPLYFTGDAYDESTGYGTVSWTGYLPAGSGFKLRGSLTDNWATQIGQADAFGSFKVNDGGSGNIAADASGYYTFTLDTKLAAMGDASCLTVTPYSESVTAYESMFISGSFNSWGDAVQMSPVNTAEGMENHDWYCYINLPAGSEVKFQTNNWAYEVGSKYNETPSYENGYYGIGAKSGGWNIYIANEGSYLVILNDITGAFHFIKQ